MMYVEKFQVAKASLPAASVDRTSKTQFAEVSNGKFGDGMFAVYGELHGTKVPPGWPSR